MKKITKFAFFAIASGVIFLSGCAELSLPKKTLINNNQNLSGANIISGSSMSGENLHILVFGSGCDIYFPDLNNSFFNKLLNSFETQKEQYNSGLILLSGFKFAKINNQYFSVNIPLYSGVIENGYILNRNDINTGVWNLDTIHVSKTDVGRIFTISLQNIYVDVAKTENRFEDISKYIGGSKYDCIYPDNRNINNQKWKVYYKYGPQMCGNNKPCLGGSNLSLYMIYQVSSEENLVLEMNDHYNNSALYQIILDKIFASLKFK